MLLIRVEGGRRHERSGRTFRLQQVRRGLLLSAVAKRPWICPLSPGRVLQTKPKGTELKITELNSRCCRCRMEFCNFFGISKLLFLLSAAPCRGQLSSPHLPAHRQFPLQGINFSAILPLWGCGKDFAPPHAVLALLASVSFESNRWSVFVWWGGGRVLKGEGKHQRSSGEKIDQEKWLLWVFVIFIARVIENFQILACIFIPSAPLPAPDLFPKLFIRLKWNLWDDKEKYRCPALCSFAYLAPFMALALFGEIVLIFELLPPRWKFWQIDGK